MMSYQPLSAEEIFAFTKKSVGSPVPVYAQL